MTRYLLRRLPSALLVLVLASMLIFGILRLVPGDPATTLAGPDATPEAVAAIRHSLGLDLSVPEQYLVWVGNLLRFDLGRSYLIGGSISELVLSGLANTLVLSGAAILLAVLLSLATALLWVGSRSRFLEALLTASNTLAVALPTFVTGVLLVLVFGVWLPILPSGGVPPNGFLAEPDIAAQYLLLPAVCLALPSSASLARFLAESLRSELSAPHVMTARAAGVPERRILLAHALPAALPTYLTALGLQAGALLGGAVLVEAIFSWPGLGQLAAQAIDRRDYPVVQVLLLLSVALFVVIQLATDLLHAYLDPRIRIGA
ncbi:ABC transporter permease [Enemella evansiae]|uniref:Peptide ABC transporter permease n=1 Tax=Enemella evansiae TaxID=2016499 RepID=A0A255G3P9_9ACTN|nr:ABC transporter permease [Enemella evansiae]PFG67098.1 peptide/nickel transport system permease protein [Propionibacteriaceae bacterium ES.041]OYN98204.1 peptide ABC transporter permease [Enemella evansiae]OYN99328.1 peptide ABC transporter permease [Enemella evansiae]OYO05410.1 peptide ABC transporter permease [Enemella evansiae]OYO10540.1 peptide ABC transporter permease [Enemella evansiae]